MAHQIIDIVTPYVAVPGAANQEVLAAAGANASIVASSVVGQAVREAVAAEDISGMVSAQVSAVVPDLVAESIADDDTVVQAAAVAAGDAAASTGASGLKAISVRTQARALGVSLTENVCTNPRGAGNLTNWSVLNGAISRSQSVAADGGWAVQGTATATNTLVMVHEWLHVTGGEAWVFGVRFRAATTNSTSGIVIQVTFYDSSSTETGTRIVSSSQSVGDGVEHEWGASATVPSTAVYARITLSAQSGFVSGDTLAAWLVTAHLGSKFLGCFDGDSASAYWTGTSGQSSSLGVITAGIADVERRRTDFDVIVVGASEAGVMAATRAARMGMSVLLVEESSRVGGVTGWALTQTDFNSSWSHGMVGWGLAREFFDMVCAERATVLPGTEEAVFERWHRREGRARPQQWISAFRRMLSTAPDLTVSLDAPLTAVSRQGGKITSVTAGGDTYTGSVIVDATQCGDVVRLAGLSSVVGREGTSAYGEDEGGALAPVSLEIDPYVTPGNVSSGLIYGVDAAAALAVGAADPRIMMSGTRTYISSASKISWPEPASYDPAKYELIARIWASSPSTYAGTDMLDALKRTFTCYQIDSNSWIEIDLNNGLWGTALPEPDSWATYVSGTLQQRREITQKARDYFLGLVKFIRTSGDSRVPANLVTAFNTYGPRARELSASGGVSPVAYVREGRRLVGGYVMTLADFSVSSGVYDTVAWAAYDRDAKPVRALVSSGRVAVEGAVWNHLDGSAFGAPIPYRVLTPKTGECTNLLAPGAPSVSRSVWTAVRAIPVLMNLGDAAGAAAAIAVARGIYVQDVTSNEVRSITGINLPAGAAVVVGPGMSGGTFDAAGMGATTVSRWPSLISTVEIPAGSSAKPRWTPNITRRGLYSVRVAYPPAQPADTELTRPTDVVFRVVHADGLTERHLSQQYPGGGGGFWEELGQFWLEPGQPSASYVELDAGASVVGSAVAGLVAFIPIQ